jgi:hypothetical protein
MERSSVPRQNHLVKGSKILNTNMKMMMALLEENGKHKQEGQTAEVTAAISGALHCAYTATGEPVMCAVFCNRVTQELQRHGHPPMVEGDGNMRQLWPL